ncbi:DUF3152 domain-containing protein [Streptomyces sp. SP18BB07]|uniref:DUF3152 domain-containing protein n=1 Tax=unclassified Streptomyces TaxID=2593676 RepID=UPI002E76B021|nr:DUF3152 domain-containing protein [Streptomyces sp. SP18BB07]MEE1766537.1 DUF3152 domain-containing protein [Streptomyces sp. SP18BB07]MEE1837157.1 DUF3152 domain-containing protein [Streptomyces sp. SP17KL33]
MPLRSGLGAVAVVGVAGLAAVGWMGGGTGETAREPAAGPSAEPSPERSRRSTAPSRSADADAGASGSPSSSPSPSSSNSGSPSPGNSPITIPRTGPGTFTTASGGSPKVGKGTPLRYRVDVEKGLSLSAAEVADEVEAVLADPRGWTTDGASAFQRVSSGPTDFVVKVATPGTVDAFCSRVGLNTRGEFNCQAGDDVMVNLERWELATPVYADDVKAYRALIINHEVGHFLGQGHVTCPGKGKPAPAMMQQIKGMKGCVPNVWPYDRDGRFLTGPSVP